MSTEQTVHWSTTDTFQPTVLDEAVYHVSWAKTPNVFPASKRSMIYAHVINKGGKGVRSPLDRM